MDIEITTTETDLAKYAKALSHPTRLAIINFLIQQNSCFCGDIVKELPVAQSTVSQHLKELKDSGLVIGEIEVPKVRYCIDKAEWEKARKMFSDFFANNCSTDCC